MNKRGQFHAAATMAKTLLHHLNRSRSGPRINAHEAVNPIRVAVERGINLLVRYVWVGTNLTREHAAHLTHVNHAARHHKSPVDSGLVKLAQEYVDIAVVARRDVGVSVNNH